MVFILYYHKISKILQLNLLKILRNKLILPFSFFFIYEKFKNIFFKI